MQNTSALMQYQPLCNNSGLALKLQLIVGSLSIIFLANDLWTSVYVLSAETFETYIMKLQTIKILFLLTHKTIMY